MGKEGIPLHEPEPFVFHFLGDVAAAENGHLLFCKGPWKNKGFMLIRHLFCFPVAPVRRFIPESGMRFQYSPAGLQDLVIQYGKDDIQGNVFMLFQEIIAGVKCLAPGFRDRVSEDSGRDQRKSDGMAVILCSQFQGPVIGSVKEFRLFVAAAFPDRTYRVNDVTGLQIKSRGYDSGPGAAVSDFAACLLQLLPSCRGKNSSADTVACPEAFICSVYDCIGLQCSNTDLFN